MDSGNLSTCYVSSSTCI